MPQITFGTGKDQFFLLASSADSFLDLTKPVSATAKSSSTSSSFSWLPINQIVIFDEQQQAGKKHMKITFGQGITPKTVIIMLDNITFVYRPDGVAVDRYVHAGIIGNSSSSAPLFGFRVAGGTKNNLQQVVVNHLGTYIPDAPVIFKCVLGSDSNNNNNNDNNNEQPEQEEEHKRFLSFLAPPLLSRLHDPSQPIPPDIIFDTAPATSPGFFKTFARTLVSRAKKRFTEGNFNLDLAYITSHMIAMGYPTPSFETEANYRNDMADVFRFFATRHREKYWVVNLCSERAFAPSCFGGRFSRLPFEDHEAPSIQLLFDFCQAVEQFLATGKPMVASTHTSALTPFLSPEARANFWKKNPPNPSSEDLPGAEGRVVSVNCKAGKGRTGTCITAWIFYERFMRATYYNLDPRIQAGSSSGSRSLEVPLPDIEECARYFGEKRTSNGSGVTIVSQMRLLRYFSRCLSELGMQLPPTIRPVRIHSLTVNHTPALDGRGGSRLFVIIRRVRQPIIWERMGRREWLGKGMKVSVDSTTNLSSASSKSVTNNKNSTTMTMTMTPDDPVTLETIGDSRKVIVSGGGAGNGGGGGAPQWVVAGSTIQIPLGQEGIEVEDEFHISLWHASTVGDGSVDINKKKKASKNKKSKNDDDDDEDEDEDINVENITDDFANNSSANTKQKLIVHGAKGEYMACACWLHSSFLELPDPSADDNTNSSHKRNVRLGLRQLDGCSKGKAIDLFEEEFNIEIEMSACVARSRNQTTSHQQGQQQQQSGNETPHQQTLSRHEIGGL